MTGRLAHHAVPDLQVQVGPSPSAVVESLASAVEAKDQATGSHLYRSAMLARACLGTLEPKLAASSEVTYGFILHDVGKIGVPESILMKPGPLTEGEWDIMRRHPEIGLGIVAPLGFDPLTTDVILSHHERWDGAGYPFGLAGEEIPFVARVFAVADGYDALTSDRSYRPGVRQEIATRWLASEAGKSFDPEIVAAFLRLLGSGTWLDGRLSA